MPATGVTVTAQGGPRHTEAQKNANIKARRLAVEAKRDSGQFVASYSSPLPAWAQYHRWQRQQGQEPGIGAYVPGGVGTYYQGNQQFSPQGTPITPGMFNPQPQPNMQGQAPRSWNPNASPGGPGGQQPGPPGTNPWDNWMTQHYGSGSYAAQPEPTPYAGREALKQAMMSNWQ